MLDNFLIQLFHEGNCVEAYKVFGAHLVTEDGVKGTRFTVFAPNAVSVMVVGEFNNWDGKNHIMEKYTDGGIWTLFIPGIKQYDLYKYRIVTRNIGIVDRADPYAFYSEMRPGTASKVYNIENFRWSDKRWLNKRTKNFDRKLNIYECHLGSWRLKKKFTETEDGEYFNYEEMSEIIIPYVKEMGYTHIEVMPLLEYPFDGSWGYQPTGYFSATSRYGHPKQLMSFINACHKEGIGVIMDYVPAHFVKDGHGLYQFDGGFVYESPHEDIRFTEWDSAYFDLGREEVRSFMMSSLNFLTNYFHFDGIRFDAVSNLIYWKGDKSRGVNEGAHEFMKRMNVRMNELHPGVMLIAEDSTDFQNVTKHPSVGGLGFDYKWDLGWMNDTLKYFKMDPIYRQYHHNLITFSMAYFYGENYILEFSHDEVVHSKGTILDKMWGTHEQKLAQMRALYVYLYMHPGKQLSFMGNELAEYLEWDEKKSLGFSILRFPAHDSFHHFVQKLNQIYNDYPCMYDHDYYFDGFEWLVVDDNEQSVFAIERKSPTGESLIGVMNFAGNTHKGYQIPINEPGIYEEILNSDQDIWAGSNLTNAKPLRSHKGQCVKKENYISINLAPFSAAIFRKKADLPKPAKKTTAKKVKSKK